MGVKFKIIGGVDGLRQRSDIVARLDLIAQDLGIGDISGNPERFHNSNIGLMSAQENAKRVLIAARKLAENDFRLAHQLADEYQADPKRDVDLVNSLLETAIGYTVSVDPSVYIPLILNPEHPNSVFLLAETLINRYQEAKIKK